MANMLDVDNAGALNPAISPAATVVQPQIERGDFSELEIHEHSGMVIKTERQLVSLDSALQLRDDMLEYASRMQGTPIQLAPLLNVWIEKENDGYRVRHSVEYIPGKSLRAIGEALPGTRRVMAREIAEAVCAMPAMPDDPDSMWTGIDLLERNIQYAGPQHKTPDQLFLVDMSPPILRHADGSLNVGTDSWSTYFYGKYFATKSGAIARYLVNAFWPVPVKPDGSEFDVELFAAGLSDIIPSEWRGQVVDAMKSFAAERCDRIGAVACAQTLQAFPR